MDSGGEMDAMSDAEFMSKVDEEEGVDNAQGNGFDLQGFDDVWACDDAPLQEAEYLRGPNPKRARPAFCDYSTKAAERSALRSKFNEADALILQEHEDTLSQAPSKVPGTFGRRNRDKGSTLPAYHKKVSHELDSDDELMMKMREKGYSDRQIADKLVKDGRTRYDPKSIATRIGRIRVAQTEHIDYLLKEGYKEWRLEDVS
jgi:hypothetical protein